MEEGEGGETGAETREFYELVLPPVDIRWDASGRVAVVDIDVPGFGIGDISVNVDGDLLTVRAQRRRGEGAAGKGGTAVQLQRPRRLDKTVRLPVSVGASARKPCTASCADGVLTVVIHAA